MARNGKRQAGWVSPEVEHLQRVVDAVRNGLMADKRVEPEREDEHDAELAEERARQLES